MAALASAPAFIGAKLSVKTSQVKAVRAVPVASLAADFGKAAAAVGASLILVASANAATVKMGGDDGSLAFVPKNLTVSSGESVTFVNNAGFPHNVVFDEDEVPAGVNADAISHEEYFNGPGEDYSITLTKAGSYSYYCEPHQGAGMAGTITVS